MTYIRKLFKQNTIISASYFLVSLCGIFSFPVWTRFFTVSEYGILSLSVTTIAFLGSFSKFGMQHAATRYYCEFNSPDSHRPIESYYSTLFIGMIVSGILLSGGYFVFLSSGLIPDLGIPKKLLLFITVIAFTEEMKGWTNATLIVEHKTFKWSIYSIVSRYGHFLLSLLFVVYLGMGLYGFFAGQTITQLVVFVMLIFPYLKSSKIRFSKFSVPFLKESIVYGLPLLGFELSLTFLAVGDRFLISYFLGIGALGLYSAGYNLCTFALGMIAGPLRMTVMPMAFELWKKEGAQKTAEFLGRVLNYYFLVVIPIFFGLNFLGRELLSFIASEKYVNASVVIFYVSFALVFQGVYFIFGMGLYIKKNTKILLAIIVSSALLNMLLNIVLIPAFGLIGAAMATCLSFLFFIAVLTWSSFKIVRVKIDYVGLARYLAASAFMIGVISIPGIRELHILFKVLIGGAAYASLILVIDSQIRSLALFELGTLIGASTRKGSI